MRILDEVWNGLAAGRWHHYGALYLLSARAGHVLVARDTLSDPAEFESRFREAITSGHPALLDIDLLALSPLGLPGPRSA